MGIIKSAQEDRWPLSGMTGVRASCWDTKVKTRRRARGANVLDRENNLRANVARVVLCLVSVCKKSLLSRLGCRGGGGGSSRSSIFRRGVEHRYNLGKS